MPLTIGYMPTVAIALSILLLVAAFVATGVLIALAMATPPQPRAPVPLAPDTSAHPAWRRRTHEPAGSRIRLLSRLLFARRSADAITLDCTLMHIEGLLPPDVDPPEGLPFTLRLRCPDTNWLAGRVEEMLKEWAEDNRELTLELISEKGKVRTKIESGGSSVHLELAGAAGLGSDLSAA